MSQPNFILYQTKEGSYSNVMVKGILERALPTKVATVYSGNDEGLTKAIGQVKQGFSAYLVPVKWGTSTIGPETLLDMCDISVKRGWAKKIA